MSTAARTAPDPATAWFWDEASSTAAVRGPGDRLVVLQRAARGGEMPPLHTRDTLESFRVLAGEVTFFVGAETVSAHAGEVVVAAAGVARSFRVESETASWLVLTRAASPERLEDFSRAVAVPRAGHPAAWPSAEEERSVASMAGANGITLLGAPGALPARPRR